MKLDFSFSACPGLKSGVTPAQERHPGPRSGTGVQLLKFHIPQTTIFVP